MKRPVVSLTLAALVSISHAQVTLTFVRHAETEANATGRYSGATLNRFSARGEQEVKTLTAELLRMPRFDDILVSPSTRAMRTIAPYLRAIHRAATVYPLLYECCTGRRPANAHPTSFKYDGKITVPHDLVGLFAVAPDESRLPMSPDYDSGLAQVAAAVARFRREYRSGRILVVGHSGQGGHFLHALTGRWIKLDNAKPLTFSPTPRS